MQIDTLKLVRLSLACVLFVSILVLGVLLKLTPVVRFGAAEGSGAALAISAVVVLASLIGFVATAIAVGRAQRRAEGPDEA